MKWVLVAPTGTVVREAEAESLAEARFRLRPIPPQHHVTSRAAHDVPSPDKGVRPTKRYTKRGMENRAWRYRQRKKGQPIPLRRKGVPNHALQHAVLHYNVQGLSDVEIARKLWEVTATVYHTRKKVLGLPSWVERMRHRVASFHALGWTDAQIAARIGKGSSQEVYRMRRRMNLPANG